MLRYTVEDMTCGHCVQAITGVVTGLDGAAQVTVDLPTKTVDVNTTASPDAVAAAIREAGYTPAAASPAAGAADQKTCCGHCS